MELISEVKEFIDGLTYKEMLKLWRFSPTGFALFQGETGEYFSKVMKEKKEKVNAVAISKEVGW